MILAPNPRTKCRACHRVAVCTVNILLQAAGRNLRFKSTLQVCEYHRQTMRVDDVLDRASWGRLCQPFVEAGHPAPDRGQCRLEFVPLNGIVKP